MKISHFLSHKLSYLGLVALIAVAMYSCTDDVPPPPVNDPPVVSVLQSPPTPVDGGSLISFNVQASTGTGSLSQVEVLEDGLRLDLDRLFFTEDLTGSGEPFGANPKLLLTQDTSGFTWKVELRVHEEVNTTKAYVFRVTDANNLSDEVTFNIATNDIPGPAVTVNRIPTTELAPDSRMTVTLVAEQGANPMSQISILEDGVLLPVSRVFWSPDSSMMGPNIPSNPALIQDNDQLAFSGRLDIIVHPESVTTKTYSIVIEDEGGRSTTRSFDITTTNENNIDTISGARLYNFSGPRAGCLDLETGIAYLQSDVNSAQCDIIDLGNSSGVWQKMVGGDNGAEVRFPEMVGSDITHYDSIVAAYETGFMPSDNNFTMSLGLNFYVKSADGNYYRVVVDAINETANDNEDYYDVTIYKDND